MPMNEEAKKEIVSNLMDAFVNGLTMDSSDFRSFINDILDVVEQADHLDDVTTGLLTLAKNVQKEMEDLNGWELDSLEQDAEEE